MHAGRFATRDFVIVTQKMQDAVDQQGLQLFPQRMSSPLRLARGRLDGDHHISQKEWLEFIRQRKRQDVSRFVLPPILAVQSVDLGVRH